MQLSPWMHGVRVRSEAVTGRDAYRGASGGRMVIEVRNPPILSALVSLFGAAMVLFAGLVLLGGNEADLSASSDVLGSLGANEVGLFGRFRMLVVAIGGLLIAAKGASALRAHTRLVVENDRLAIDAGGGEVTRHTLVDALRVLADPITGDVTLEGSEGRSPIAESLLPEQAAMVADALGAALRARGKGPR